MWEFIIFTAVFLLFGFAAHQIAGRRLSRRILELTQAKMGLQSVLQTPNAEYYRELFAATDAVVNRMCRDFKSFNVLYETATLDGSVAEMVHLNWSQSYLVIGIDVAEKYRGDDLLKSLVAHELGHYEIRHLHLLQAKALSCFYDALYFSMCWQLYRNYGDFSSLILFFLFANCLMAIWKIVFRAFLRRNEYRCDALSFKFYPNGCLPFMELKDSLPDDLSMRDGAPRRLAWWERSLFLFRTHPPKAERLARLRAKAAQPAASFAPTRL